MRTSLRIVIAALCWAICVLPALGQQTNAAPRPNAPSSWTTQEDHQDMLRQLGIRRLRPGPTAQTGRTNSANYDPAKANPYPDLPELLRTKSGQPVRTAAEWWKLRRPEIAEDFEREVLGRVPAQVPEVRWTVVSNVTDGLVGNLPARGKRLIGQVDNAIYPEITVEIRMTVVTPVQATSAVPILMMFGGFGGDGLPLPAGTPPPTNRFPEFGGPYRDPPSREQLLAAGWGYATIAPYSVQADNGAGLTKGIIGLVNCGQARKPEDWGALRAWAWGASRGLDYLERDPAVDGKRVGIEGVSRFGKAALIAMAFDQRFAVALVGSSGEGGAKLHRRNFGEAVENLTGNGAYHWMAGNFLKYGAEESEFGRKDAGDLPVDAHMLIALCAPRPVFISYGIPERGDALWLDQQGSYMAAVAAQPVYRLLGARDLGEKRDYRQATMPPVNTGLLDGELAWRQHDGGHEDRSNMKYFIEWAGDKLKPARAQSRMRAQPRTDANSRLAHEQLLEKARRGRIDLYFLGDSITRRWGAADPQYRELLENWKSNFHGWNAGNFGWGGDRVENVLWRMENGELDGVNPKVIVLQAGINNIGREAADEGKVQEVTAGLRKLVEVLQEKAPGATVILTGLFPRNDNLAAMPGIRAINRNLAALADGQRIRYVDINDQIADAEGRFLPGMVNEDGLHPSVKTYQIWADALKPILRVLLGARGTSDQAPPPTGDPSAMNRAK